MARDILDLGADVFDDTQETKKRRISPKKRNYIIGLSCLGLVLAGAITLAVVAANTWLLDVDNLKGLQFYYTPKDKTDPNAKEPTLTLYKLDSSINYPSTFRIPEKVQGLKVTAIAPQAFNNHKEIKEVVFTSYVDTIGEKAFAGCSNIENFRWNKAINYIGKGAFDDTKYFKNLKEDPSNITRIPSGILINIGADYLKDIGTGENLALVSDDFNYDDPTSKAKLDKYGIPSTNVRKFSDLKSGDDEGETTGFIAGLFQNNQRISFLEMPEFLTQLGEETFKGCSNLKYVDFSQSQITSISKGNFADCTSLGEIYFSETLTELGDNAFENTKITELPALDYITNFGENVFYKCSKLETVYYPDTEKLTKVPNGMFKQCTSLKEFYWGDEFNTGGNYIESIGVGAFQGTALEEFYVPKSVSIIHDSAFENCTSLEKLYLYGNPNNEYNDKTIAKDDNGVYQYDQKEIEGSFDLANFDTELVISLDDRDSFNIQADGDGNFVFDVTNPSSTIQIGNAKFTLDDENFQLIKKAIIKQRGEDEGDTSEETSSETSEEGEGGEDSDTELNVVIQDESKFFSLTFAQDQNTKKFVVTLNSIKTYTRDTEGNYHLGYLTGVNDIRKNAFNKCTKLNTIRLYDDDFNFISEDEMFTFPKSLMLLNRSVQGFGVMNTFANTAATSIYFDAYTQEIGDRAFRKVTGLSEVKFSEHSSLVSIGDAAFAENPLLEEISIPASVKTILAGAFENDEGLTKINIKDTKIITITEALFAGCVSLEHIDLPETVTQVKKNAFDSNSSLDYVVLPAAVNTIEASSFVKCANGIRGNLPIYLNMTSAKYNASSSINKKFHDNTCDHFFLLEPGAEKEEGLRYWNGDASNPQEI